MSDRRTLLAGNIIAFRKPQSPEIPVTVRVTPAEIVALGMAMDSDGLTLWLKLGRAFVQAGGRA